MIFFEGGVSTTSLRCLFGFSGEAISSSLSTQALGLGSARFLLCQAPPASPGFVAVRLADAGVVSSAGPDGVLQYMSRSEPHVTAALPTLLDARGGTLLTLAGADFTATSRCQIADAQISASLTTLFSTALLRCETEASMVSEPVLVAVVTASPYEDFVTVLPLFATTSISPLPFDAPAVAIVYTLARAADTVATDGQHGGPFCAVGTVSMAASWAANGVIDCPRSAATGAGVSWQDIEHFALAVPPSELFTMPASLPLLETFPEFAPAAGLPLTIYTAELLKDSSLIELQCHFTGPSASLTTHATFRAPSVICPSPPSILRFGGFLVLRLSATVADTASVELAQGQLQFVPAATVTGIALPQPGALVFDVGQQPRFGVDVWFGRPFAVQGAELLETPLACRVHEAVIPSEWVSSALVRCEPPAAFVTEQYHITVGSLAGGWAASSLLMVWPSPES